MQIIPERLDATRLLKVIDNIEHGLSTPRREGTTLAFFYLMLQTICHDDHDTHYAYVGSYQKTIKNVVHQFADFLKQRGETFSFIESRNRIIVSEPNQTFDFVSSDRFIDGEFVRGRIFKKIFVDIWLETLTDQQRQHWDQTVQQVKCHNTELLG